MTSARLRRIQELGTEDSDSSVSWWNAVIPKCSHDNTSTKPRGDFYLCSGPPITLHAVMGRSQSGSYDWQAVLETQEALSCSKPSVELASVKGRGHKVIGTSLHTLDDILLLRAIRQKNLADKAVLVMMSNAANQFQSVQAWDYPITDDDSLALKCRLSLSSIGRGKNIVSPTLKNFTEHRARYGIVFGNQDVHGRFPFVGNLLTNVSSLPVAL